MISHWSVSIFIYLHPLLYCPFTVLYWLTVWLGLNSLLRYSLRDCRMLVVWCPLVVKEFSSLPPTAPSSCKQMHIGKHWIFMYMNNHYSSSNKWEHFSLSILCITGFTLQIISTTFKSLKETCLHSNTGEVVMHYMYKWLIKHLVINYQLNNHI